MGLHVGWLFHALLSLIVAAAAFLVPAFYSFKALEAHQQNVEQWLTYWLVLGTWTTLEVLFSVLVRRIPFFLVIKLAFVLWLQLPQTQVRRRCCAACSADSSFVGSVTMPLRSVTNHIRMRPAISGSMRAMP